MTLHVVRESGPFGFSALESTVRSAFGVAGFSLERILDWQGCIDDAGEIVREPKEIVVQSAPGAADTAEPDVCDDAPKGASA